MYKLYYKPLACSLAVHIALIELGLDFELIPVSKEHGALMAGGRPLAEIHIPTAVPLLETPAGEIMAETAVILEYLAGRVGIPALAPYYGGKKYWDFRQTMNFIATDIHKNYGPLFNDDISNGMRATWLGRLLDRFTHVEVLLNQKQALAGPDFSVADAYMFVMLHWASYVGVDLSNWPRVKQYYDDLADRSSIRQALKAELG